MINENINAPLNNVMLKKNETFKTRYHRLKNDFGSMINYINKFKFLQMKKNSKYDFVTTR